MAHPRKELRNKIVATLKLANTLAGDNVEPFPVEPEDVETDVRIGMMIADEASQRAGKGLPLSRDMALTLVARVPGTENAAAIDRADDLAEQIEAWWLGDETFDDTAQRSVLVATEVDLQSGQIKIAEIKFTFSVRVQRGPVAT